MARLDLDCIRTRPEQEIRSVFYAVGENNDTVSLPLSHITYEGRKRGALGLYIRDERGHLQWVADFHLHTGKEILG